MPVFKCALEIIRGHIVFPIVYIVGLGFMGIFMAMSLSFPSADGEFALSKVDYAFIDRDGSVVSQGIGEVLAECGEAVFVEDDSVAMQDAVAKGAVDYLMIVPPGFGSDFIEAAKDGGMLPKAEVVYSFYSADGVFVDERVNGFLGLLRTELLVDPAVSESDAVAEAYAIASEKVPSEKMRADTESVDTERFVFYMQWNTYTLVAGVVACVGMLTVILGRADVRRRNLTAPISYASYYFQVALSCLFIAVLAWIWSFGLGLAVFPGAMEFLSLESILCLALCMLAFTLVPLAVGYLLGQCGLSLLMCNAIGNIFGMILSFLGGAWISLDMLSPEVVAVSHCLPAYWYTDACLNAAYPGVEGHTLFAAFQDIGVLLLFAAAILCVAFLVGKMRLQTSESGGNRAAEVKVGM